MKKHYTLSIPSLLLCLLMIVPAINKGQTTTISLRPGAADGKDAFLASGAASVNYGNHPELASFGWTCSGSACFARGLFEFDLTTIPSNVTITSASLSLYANPTPSNAGGVAMNGSANTSYIQRVVEPWSETTVTWGNQPMTTTVNQVSLPQTTSSFQDFLNLDVAGMVQDMVDNPGSSYGFMLRLQNEQYYNSMIFASSDYSDPNVHPMLVITYTTANTTCITFKPAANEGKDAFLASGAPGTNYPVHPELASFGWTCGGSPCFARGLFEFDLSSIPSNATLVSANLSLYANPAPSNAGGIAMNGSANTSYIQRVVQPWSETAVTWDNQPTTTISNQVILSQSTSSFEDYLDINVKAMVQDMISNPSSSYGFMLRLETEAYYNSMIFASSDYPDPAVHPSLTLCYIDPSGINEKSIFLSGVSVFPNPARDIINLRLKLHKSTEVNVGFYNVLGEKVFGSDQLMFTEGDHELSFSTSEVKCDSPGIYFVRVESPDGGITTRFVYTPY